MPRRQKSSKPRKQRTATLVRTPANPDHKFEFNLYLPDINAPFTGSGIGGTLSFQFADIPGISSVYGLFDQISLDRVDLMFIPNCTEVLCTYPGLGGGGLQHAVTFHTAVDTTYGTSPPALNDIIQYRNQQMSVYPRQHIVRGIVPRAQFISEDNVGADGVGVAPAHTFFGTENTNNHTIVHNGLLYFVNNYNPAWIAGQCTVPSWQVFARYYVTARNQK